MSPDHVHALDKKISALSDALARLGRGTTLAELLKIIRQPGWTTPAEFSFAVALINALHAHIAEIETLQGELLAASKSVGMRG
ncbi:MAG: hypothetical protein QM741_16280 [Rudaea sp.]|uniref:hypothetical protein n=1 Tax=Rudaea sp. TaxID=2136325 RepID=UPI0039E597C0